MIDFFNLPPSLVGKTLKQVNLRADYNVTVLSVRRKNSYGVEKSYVPGPGTVLKKDDVLIIVATKKDIDKFKNEYASQI